MLDPKLFLHPEDEAALRTLEAIPGFSMLIKAFLKVGYEKMSHGINMASKIRLSPTQLPEIYQRLPPICQKMGIAEPEFYLEMNSQPNASTFGDTQISICVTSGLLEYLDDNEINSVIAHEYGHIMCRHVLYKTVADMLLNGIDILGVLGQLADTIITPMKYAFWYWSRKSEHSADRAAALVMGVDEVVRTRVRLSGGPKAITHGFNLQEWVKQADAYDEICKDGAWSKTLQGLAASGNTHPFSAVRVREILRWSETEQFRIAQAVLEGKDVGTLCPTCYHPVTPGWAFCKQCGVRQKG